MALPTYSYHKVVMQWGCDATDGWDPNMFGDTICHESLTPTGTLGTDWAVLSTREYLRQAGYNFASGWSLVHFFAINARYDGDPVSPGGTVRFRIQDVTNDNTISEIRISSTQFYTLRGNTGVSAFSNIPTADARIQLQYSLQTDDAADWRYASWEILNDRRVG